MIDNIEPTKDSFHLLQSSGWLNYLIVMVLSLWAGFVSYFQKKKEEFNWLNMFVHISSAGFAGVMAQLVCMHLGIDGPFQAAISGISAYTGTPALVKILMRLKDVQRIFGEDKEQKSDQ